MSNLRSSVPITPVPTRSRTSGRAKKPGSLRVACVFVFCAATAIASPAQTLTTLVDFEVANGALPSTMSLVQGFDGNLYGTTPFGGANENAVCDIYNNGSPDCGTVFKITPGGTLTTLYSFCALTNCSDGDVPIAGLIQGADGSFYGTAYGGGDSGYGTVFKITPGGTLTTLHSFDSTDGANPAAALFQGNYGVLYGTTVNGGAKGYGTVFKITPGGALTTLHSFGGADGANPWGVLIQATDGNFYGTAYGGGDSGYGTVFKITPGGTLTILHSFDSTDGANPDAGLVQATDGNFYGTTVQGASGGCSGVGCGSVFRITPAGKLTALFSFDYSGSGVLPYPGLIQATDGNLYGAVWTGPADVGAEGAVFGITTKGGFTDVAGFNGADGAGPVGELLQATNGILYGTTGNGGNDGCNFSGCGTVYSLSMGLGPFVSLLHSTGLVGQSEQILGQGFIGTTGVSFNGIPAKFTVKSDTYLTATVPAGASTGVVTVTAPSGTLTSNRTFRVVPQIKSFTPTSGPVGTSVVITGKSFIGVIDVHFGSVKVTSFKVDSDTQIRATVPAGTKTADVSICTAGGCAESAISFTVTP
jgi:uncharacterized repeat protein (TIGR03803 family)